MSSIPKPKPIEAVVLVATTMTFEGFAVYFATTGDWVIFGVMTLFTVLGAAQLLKQLGIGLTRHNDS